MIVVDAMGNELNIDKVPDRIISLVPSQTEYIYDLGLKSKLIGITKFCIHPNHLRNQVQIVGGTKKIDLEKICKLNPDLIVANKEENTKEDIEFLQKRFNVYISDVKDFKSAGKMMYDVGVMTGTDALAQQIIKQIEESFSLLENQFVSVSAIYLIWQNPFMLAASGTFISYMMQKAGFINSISTIGEPYPKVDLDFIKRVDSEFILLSSEPFPFKKKHQLDLRASTGRDNILLVNGEMFSWYGSRMIQSAGYFKKLRKNIN